MAMTLEIGQPAPAFSLPDQDGAPVASGDLLGSWVVLYFYPKDNTPGCTAQACGFRDRFEEIQEKNAVVVGVSPDSAASHVNFRSKYNLPFILLSDPDHKVAEKYGTWGEKVMMGRKYMGILRSHFVIDEQGKIVDAQVKVKADASPELAMQALPTEP